MRAAREVVDVARELGSLYASVLGQRFVIGWLEARARDGYPCASSADSWRRREIARLAHGDLYFVSREMGELAYHAGRSMPQEPLLATDLPSPAGFLVFEVPFIVRDAHSVAVSIGAFSWERAMDTHGNEGLAVTWYSLVSDQRDEYLAQLRAEGIALPTRYILLGDTSKMFGTADDAAAIADRFHVPIDIAEEHVYFSETMLRSLWALMGQRLAVVESHRQDRAARRRAEREGRSDANRTVQVVTLRRPPLPRKDSAEAQPIEWSHRWLVSGHWRNVWHPSLQVHRLQWIHPFIKGPDDKPLVVKDKVFSLTR